MFDLVSGQVPSHGETYWTLREVRLDTRLRSNIMDLPTRLFLAEARAALGRDGEAGTVLASIEQLDPGNAGAAALLADLRERAGGFLSAAESLSAALLRNQDVCPGLGDFHLRALRWSASQRNIGFLDEPYSTWPTPGAGPRVDYFRLLLLATRCPRFPDAMLVLGDELSRRGAQNLAIWAWVRALDLGHPAKSELSRRLETTFFLWRVGSGRAEASIDAAMAAIRRNVSTAERWRTGFQRVEWRLVLEGREPGIAEVLAECRRCGISRAAAGDFAELPIGEAELIAAEPRPEPPRSNPARPPRLDPWTVSALRTLAIAAGTLFLACIACLIVARLAPISPRKSRALTLSRYAQRMRSRRRGPSMFGGICAC